LGWFGILQQNQHFGVPPRIQTIPSSVRKAVVQDKQLARTVAAVAVEQVRRHRRKSGLVAARTEAPVAGGRQM